MSNKNIYDVILGQIIKFIKFFQTTMNIQKHKSVKLTPGVKRIQNYLFKFSDLLGKGNFSSVYKGTNELTSQTVAIKYIALSSLTCERLKQLLDQQIEILTSLNHPNIVKCFEVLKSSHNCYIITELCDGGDLQGMLKQKHFFTEDQMIPYVKDIYEGLYYLSKKNIVHRDVKVANIFLNKGKAKIADFGFAQRSKKQFNDGKIGTPLCMSPEGFLQNLYGCKTDVWAFGIILYQLTHGRLPLENCTTEEMLRKNIQKQITADQLRPQLSIELKDLIVRCLDVNPCTRITFQDMKNTAFVRKLTGTRVPIFSLQDLRYIPSFHTSEHEGNENDSFIISLKNLDLPQYNHLNTNEKTQISKQNEHLNFAYGKVKICQELKPQNTIEKIEKQKRCICRPEKIQIPTMTYIPMRRDSGKQNKEPQSPMTSTDLFKNNEQFSITISHKSYSTLPADNSDPFLNTPQKDKSLLSTTDQDQLSIPNSPLTVPPFRRHKGSFELTSAESREIIQMNTTMNGRPISSRPSLEIPDNIRITDPTSMRKEKVQVNICPISNTKRLLSGFLKFNEAIGLIHYCRLMYKYISELKSTGIYHLGDLNLRYYSNYLLNIMNELLNKITSDHIILTKTSLQNEGKENKLNKMRKVIEEYIERYKPNLEKERAEYLNRTTGQIKQIIVLDQRFIDTFFIPDKSKLQFYNAKLVKFSEILERCSRYQKYSEFDSNNELQELTKEVKQEKKERPLFTETYPQNIQKTQTLKVEISHKAENANRKVSFQGFERNNQVFMNDTHIS